jgi:hypothetical protein
MLTVLNDVLVAVESPLGGFPECEVITNKIEYRLDILCQRIHFCFRPGNIPPGKEFVHNLWILNKLWNAAIIKVTTPSMNVSGG